MARSLLPEDLYLLRQVTDCALHPDGRRVAFVVSWMDQETDTNRSVLWLHEGDPPADSVVQPGVNRDLGKSTFTTHGARQVSYGHADSMPRFSPDGRWLAYLSAPHKGPPQLKVMPLAGGEPRSLTSADDGVSELAWLPDATGLVFTAPVRPEHQRGKSGVELDRMPQPRRITDIGYRFNGRGFINDRRRHVFLLRLPHPGEAPRSPIQLTDGPRDDSAPAPSPDGRTITFISARHPDHTYVGGNDVWSVPTKGGRPKRLTNGGNWGQANWHPTEPQLLLIGSTERGVVDLSSVFVLDLGQRGRPRRLGDGQISTIAVGTPLSISGGHVLVHGVRRGAVHIDRYELGSGARSTIVDGQRTVGSFASSHDGNRLVFVASGTNTPTELYERVDGRERCLTAVSAPFLKVVSLAPMTEASTAAGDGTPVHLFVCAPSGRGKRPGLLYVHGGPLTQYGWGFNGEFQIAASAGYVVVGPNPRGSDGYGLEHANAITARYGTDDWLDVQASADYLAARADVDADRLGIGGGSYGGFMVAWATARTHRFRAALVERAVINWVTMEATSDITWFMRTQLGTTTLDNAESMRQQSPITWVKNVRTPTLVLHSEEDWRCPIEQGEQWFAALRRNGVPAEFVRFPGENHELTRSGRPSLRLERFRIVHDWFADYLGGGRFARPLSDPTPQGSMC